MIVTAEHEIDFNKIMEYVYDEIKRAIDEEGIDWDSLTDDSQKDLYKKIAECILKEWA